MPILRETPVRIAAAQYPIERFSTLGGCRDKLARWVGEAASEGAELLVFPEYGAMEYAGCRAGADGDLAASLSAASDARAEMDAAHAELARRHRVHILGSSGPVRRGDRFVNTSGLFAPSGESAAQDKRMMTPFERDWGISPGTQPRVVATSLGRIGIAICYDSEFPLLVRALCAAGADLILIPSCTEFASGWNRVRTAALARALENGCAAIVSATVGDAPWSPAVDRNFGAAGLYGPAEQGLSDTGVLVEGIANRPGWVHGRIDPAHLNAIRTGGEMRNAADWDSQPGAAAQTFDVEVIALM